VAESGTNASIWLYSDDQIFSDRIASTASSLSIPFLRIGEGDLPTLPSHRGLLIVDLDRGLAPVQHAIALARSAGPGSWHICGYGAHVDAAGLQALRDAGADRVVSRSSLIQTLQDIIQEAITR
jgi:hypothetical protein